MNEHRIRTMLEGGGGWPGQLARAVLWLPGKLYGGLMELRRAAYLTRTLASSHPGIPVISVGNVTAGGTGKTPFVAMLSQELHALGYRSAILLRGYRRSESGESDEEMLYRRLCPEALIEAGANRLRSAERAIREGAGVILLDDGFQHLRIRRDLDLVLIDALSPWGGGNTIPGGLLREPLSALARVGGVIVTRADQVDQKVVDELKARLKILAPHAVVFTARHRPTRLRRLDGTDIPFDNLNNRNVLALCGIARPEAFAKTLSSLGANVIDVVAGPDHADFTQEFIAAVLTRSDKEAAIVVTTEKDGVKSIFSRLTDNNVDINNVWVLGVDQEVDDRAALLDLIGGALKTGSC